MSQKYPQKDKTPLPVIYTIISYAPEDTLLQIESLKMFFNDAASAYTNAIHAPNEHFL